MTEEELEKKAEDYATYWCNEYYGLEKTSNDYKLANCEHECLVKWEESRTAYIDGYNNCVEEHKTVISESEKTLDIAYTKLRMLEARNESKMLIIDRLTKLLDRDEVSQAFTGKTYPLVIKMKVSDTGKLPEKKTAGAACYDCYSAIEYTLQPGECKVIPLGFKVEVPEGYYMEVRGRSGLSTKNLLVMTGTVDSDYRGEVGAIMTNLGSEPYKLCMFERVAQMMIKKVIDTQLCTVEELTETERGEGGFGSTGK